MFLYLFVFLIVKCETSPVFSDEFEVENAFDWNKWEQELGICNYIQFDLA